MFLHVLSSYSWNYCAALRARLISRVPWARITIQSQWNMQKYGYSVIPWQIIHYRFISPSSTSLLFFRSALTSSSSALSSRLRPLQHPCSPGEVKKFLRWCGTFKELKLFTARLWNCSVYHIRSMSKFSTYTLASFECHSRLSSPTLS